MHKNLILVVASTAVLVACTSPENQDLNLFNGEDLTGWEADVAAMDTDKNAQSPFLVRDGKLVSMGTPRGALVSKKSYSNYRLQVEYCFAAKPGNCGVLVHSSKLRVFNNIWPQSLEVQLMNQNASDFWCIHENIKVPDMEKRRGPKSEWGITQGKKRRIMNLTNSSEKPIGEWNKMVIECVGNSIKVWVNDDIVNYGTDCTVTTGKIALQAEGSEVEFRKVTLTPIIFLTE